MDEDVRKAFSDGVDQGWHNATDHFKGLLRNSLELSKQRNELFECLYCRGWDDAMREAELMITEKIPNDAPLKENHPFNDVFDTPDEED